MTDFTELELKLFSTFENYFFKDEKWVLQKRIAYNKRGIPVDHLSFFDYEYKIRKENQLGWDDAFDYYVIIFNNYEEFEIDYENFFGGIMPDGPLPSKRLKFFSLDVFKDLKSTKEFINWLLSNYGPSRFSFT